MRILVLKVLCWLCLAITTSNFAYSSASIDSKNAYIESELKRKLSTKDQHSNRYASLLTASSRHSKISTTQRPSWSYPELTNSKYSYSNLNSVRLRHSRYPNLDGVLTRLDKLRTPSIVSTTNSPKYQYQKFSSKASDNLLTRWDEDTNDNEEEENITDYEYNTNEEDEDNYDTLDDDWQAEEATESSPKTLTEYKWENYGTRSRVEESRRNQNFPEHTNSYVEVNAAIQHAVRMNKESRCRDPFPRVMSVQNIYPDPGKSYLPHCTVLHRCAEDTGCCPSHLTTCAPKKQTVVYLYFYITTIGQTGSKVEKLPFYNHTECACLEKSVKPMTLEAAPAPDSNKESTRSYRSNLSVRAADFPETIRKCKCPKEFNPMLNDENKCACDCADTNFNCLHIKLGNEYFSLKDRLCIMNEECGVPKCEYGPYIRDKGRCPHKQEKLDAFASVSTNLK
ncbi:hypothetical protein FQR65_LT00637 [Abscondita terminalis]|nr:hypothetical protein FQR65_LT00637 [Abscondita terminalis]